MTTNKKSENKFSSILFGILITLALWLREFVLFITLLLKPLIIISFIFTVLIIWYSQTQKEANRLIFEIVATISSGVVGGLITNSVIEHFGNTILNKKSGGAIRNLQLIKYKVTNISKRLSELLTHQIRREFDEIDNLVQNVHKDIINSISDWSDINNT